MAKSVAVSLSITRSYLTFLEVEIGVNSALSGSVYMNWKFERGMVENSAWGLCLVMSGVRLAYSRENISKLRLDRRI